MQTSLNISRSSDSPTNKKEHPRESVLGKDVNNTLCKVSINRIFLPLFVAMYSISPGEHWELSGAVPTTVRIGLPTLLEPQFRFGDKPLKVLSSVSPKRDCGAKGVKCK